MTAIKVPYQFKEDSQYIDDFGREAGITGVLAIPEDMEAKIDEILEAIQAERKTSSVPCNDKAALKPRKVTIIRTNGNSFSFYIYDRPKIVEVSKAVWDIFKSSDFKGVCAKLIGEKWINVYEDFAPSSKTEITPGKPIKPPEETGKHRLVFSATMKEYKVDAVFGAVSLMGFSSQTDTLPDEDGHSQPYSDLQKEINDCIGTLTNVRACGGSGNYRTYRRFTASVLTKDGEEDELLQTVTVPQADNESAKIKECAEALAENKSVACLAYEGESNNRLHKLSEFVEQN
jgi:hypothetical protein